MMITDIPNARLRTNAVVQVHGASAGDEKDMANTPVGELAHDIVGKLCQLLTSATTTGECALRAIFHAIVRSIASRRRTEEVSPNSSRARCVLGTYRAARAPGTCLPAIS